MRLLIAILPLVSSMGLIGPRPAEAQTSIGKLSISSELIDGSEWWSIRAQNVPLERFLDQFASRSGRRVLGGEELGRAVLVTATLDRRPMEQTIEYVLGSVGLRADLTRSTLSVSVDDLAEREWDDLANQAAAAWLQALTRYPGHASAPEARLALGELAEVRQNLSAARDHYESLIDSYPDSVLVPEAMMRAGRILKRSENWVEASHHFRRLASRPDAPEYEVGARLELARCTIELGNPESARFLLNALDTEYPAVEVTDQTERLLVRAQALNELGRHMDALRSLDQAEIGIDPLAEREALRIRAIALEGVGMPGEAGRAWLLFAQDGTADEAAFAFGQAARLALDAGDEIGALFVCEEASLAGVDLEQYRVEARHRLGFDVLTEARESDLHRELREASELLEGGRILRAKDIVQPLFQSRNRYEEPVAAEISVLWARCLEIETGLDAGIKLLSSVRPSFRSIEAREVLDRGAAQMFERHEMFDRAVDAYRGVF